MKDSIADITKWILYALIGLSAILGVLFYTGTITSEGFIIGGRWMLIIGVAVMIISPIYTFITNPRNLVKLLISLAIFAVIVVISYFTAENTFTELQLDTLKTTAETSRLVGMGLYVTYIAFGLAILAAIYASIVKAFK